ncbi:hypothetical protein F5Y10DRAFT_257099 [Nemania abortiva]|nr:hypothetical protein F5Y10DRAFT_257099 [Nemania abortiva]
MSRENPASSSPATTASATGLNSTLRRDPHHIPPTFPPAVKARIYSDSERGSQGNSSTKSKKLEALGFASGTQPAARTANATKRENASVGTVAPTPLCKSKPPPIPRPSIKRVKQEAEEPAQAQITAFLTVPRTPEQPTAMRRAYNWSSPSIGTSADPYTLSSDDDDDDDDDDTATTHGKPYNLPPLQSFANIADMYETASDVEAVLDQFPAWLSTPSPPEPRSINRSVPPTSRPITAPRLNGRPGADEDGNRSGERRESRRVRFRGDDGFSSSPVPPKRVVAPIERASPRAKRIHVSKITSNEPTSCNFNYDDDGGSSAQHRKDIQSRKWRKLKARSREDKRASRHRNKNREAWRRQKKAKRGHSI